MTFVRLVGIVLIILGVVALAYQGISYTTRERVADIGPVKVTREAGKTIPLLPFLGALAFAGGIVLVAVGPGGSVRQAKVFFLYAGVIDRLSLCSSHGRIADTTFPESRWIVLHRRVRRQH